MKGKLLSIITALHILLFVIFYKSMLSMEAVPLYRWFYLCYVSIVVVTIILFVFLKKKKAVYIATGVSCALVLVLFVGYSIYDRAGYRIDPSDVKEIEFWDAGENSRKVKTDNEDVIKNVIEEYNDNTSIKRWEGGGQIGTPDHQVTIYLKDGTEASFTSDCVVWKDGKEYRGTFDYWKIVDYIEQK